MFTSNQKNVTIRLVRYNNLIIFPQYSIATLSSDDYVLLYYQTCQPSLFLPKKTGDEQIYVSVRNDSCRRFERLIFSYINWRSSEAPPTSLYLMRPYFKLNGEYFQSVNMESTLSMYVQLS